MGNLITISEAIEKYKVTRKTLYTWRQSGKLRETKIHGKLKLYEEDIEKNTELKSTYRSGVMTHELPIDIEGLTSRIKQLEQVITHLVYEVKKGNEKVDRLERFLTHQKTANKPERTVTDQSYHQNRAKAVIEKGRSAYQSLTQELGREPQKTEVAERAEIARGSVNKYWGKITS